MTAAEYMDLCRQFAEVEATLVKAAEIGNTATFHAVLVDRNAIAEKLLAARAETAEELAQ